MLHFLRQPDYNKTKKKSFCEKMRQFLKKVRPAEWRFEANDDEAKVTKYGDHKTDSEIFAVDYPFREENSYF